ncbi:MAG: hypothetical protein IPP71_22460 [Bacteroidetes bacterium]|nr:hypothetical protein [Bacteroidota bacterium]
MSKKVSLEEYLLTIYNYCGKMWDFFFYLYAPLLVKSRLHPEIAAKKKGELVK